MPVEAGSGAAGRARGRIKTRSSRPRSRPRATRAAAALEARERVIEEREVVVREKDPAGGPDSGGERLRSARTAAFGIRTRSCSRRRRARGPPGGIE